MGSQVKLVGQHEVGDRTALNADLPLLHDLNELWVVCKVESVTNSLGSKQDGVVQLLVILHVRLSAVKEQRELDTQRGSFSLSFKELRQEFLDSWSKVFLANHIVADDHIFVLIKRLSIEIGINLSLNVILTEDFETTSDNLELEKRETLLKSLDDSVKESQLSSHVQWTILIKDASKDVFDFNNCHHLSSKLSH